MRSTSSGRSRSKRRKGKSVIKLLLVFLAILAGALRAVEARYQTLRIAEIEADSAITSLMTATIWAEVPRKAVDFWPLLWLSKRTYEAAIEREHPVKVDLRLKEWGRFSLKIEYLNPLFRLYWENNYWFVSSEGKMWLTKLPDNNLINLSDVLRRPVLAWGKERSTPFDIANANSGVHRSSLPVTQIEAWYNNIETLAWTEPIKSMYTGQKEGLSVVRLVFDNGVGVLFPDNPELWMGSGLAVQKIFPDIMKISPDIFIDTTYKDKIIVSNRVK